MKKATTIAELSRRTGIAPVTLRTWRDKERVDVFNPKELEKRIALKQQRSDKAPPTATGTTTGESYAEARRRREIANADRAEILAQQAAGSVVDLLTVEAAFAAVGFEVKGRLLNLRGELVHQLEGRTAPQIYKVLDDAFCGLLENMHARAPMPPNKS